MSDAELELFVYAAGRVTPADVAAFAPGDPGYPNYVAAFNHILSSGDLPDRPSFDVRETIGLTRWVDADREADPVRFRRFRVLSSVVALSQLLAGVEAEDALPPNYGVVSLLNDGYRLGDRTLVRLSRPALDVLHVHLADRGSEEAPFALLGLLLVDAYLGAGVGPLADVAERLIACDGRQVGRKSGDFVLGCTYFDQLHGLWVWLVDRLVPAATPGLRLVRDAIMCGGPWGTVPTR